MIKERKLLKRESFFLLLLLLLRDTLQNYFTSHFVITLKNSLKFILKYATRKDPPNKEHNQIHCAHFYGGQGQTLHLRGNMEFYGIIVPYSK